MQKKLQFCQIQKKTCPSCPLATLEAHIDISQEREGRKICSSIENLEKIEWEAGAPLEKKETKKYDEQAAYRRSERCKTPRS